MFDDSNTCGPDLGRGSSSTAGGSPRARLGFRKPALEVGHAPPPGPHGPPGPPGPPGPHGASGATGLPADDPGAARARSDGDGPSGAGGSGRAPDVGAALGVDFRALLTLLHQRGVRYLVVGGFAVAIHGRPRFTPALDLWIDATGDNAARLLAALGDFGFPTGDLGTDDLVEPGLAFELGHAPNRVDVLTSLLGASFTRAYPARTHVWIGALDVDVIDRASLIANKRAVGRPRDLDDVSKIVLRRDLQPVPRIPGGERDAASGWRSRTAAERIAEVEELRRQWVDITGNPDAPMARFVARRCLDYPASRRPR